MFKPLQLVYVRILRCDGRVVCVAGQWVDVWLENGTVITVDADKLEIIPEDDKGAA